MQQKSRSKIAVLPLVLFVLIPILDFVAFRHYGVFFIAVFITHMFSAISQLFRSYEIKNGIFVINDLFSKKEIPLSQIRMVENKKANIWQKLFAGYPDEYQMLSYNTYDDIAIMPQNQLVYHATTHQFYFKN